MTKALLVIWIGFGYAENQSLTVVDSMEECLAARAAIIASEKAPDHGVHCIEYTY